MNDQEQPEIGTPLPADAAEQAMMAETIPITLTEDSVDDAVDELEPEADSYVDEDELDADDFDEDEQEEVRVRSLVEELFDEDDFAEVMSELDVLTLEDAADYLKVEYGAIRRMLKEQGLPGRKIGDEWRFLRGALADWLRAPGGNAPTTVAAAPVPVRAEQPAQSQRREFTQRPPLRERFSQGADEEQQPRFPQHGGSRYPQQGGARYPQENRPPRRPQNSGGGGYQGGGYQGGQGGGGYQGGQGGYPPPRRPRYGNDQEQQPQGEYRPPRRPFAGGQGGGYENQAGGNFAGGGASGSAGGRKYGGGPKKPKRKALNEQRFKRLDRRKDEGGAEQGPQDSDD
ncbi:MAG: helix-turn-helix domain-containing protein [Planctomycetes bacterium]|nr:helix-turn-helix domain-containing protein [Planctomycetota bacterium]